MWIFKLALVWLGYLMIIKADQPLMDLKYVALAKGSTLYGLLRPSDGEKVREVRFVNDVGDVIATISLTDWTVTAVRTLVTDVIYNLYQKDPLVKAVLKAGRPFRDIQKLIKAARVKFSQSVQTGFGGRYQINEQPAIEYY